MKEKCIYFWVTKVIKGEDGLVELLEDQVCLLGRLWSRWLGRLRWLWKVELVRLVDWKVRIAKMVMNVKIIMEIRTVSCGEDG